MVKEFLFDLVQVVTVGDFSLSGKSISHEGKSSWRRSELHLEHVLDGVIVPLTLKLLHRYQNPTMALFEEPVKAAKFLRVAGILQLQQLGNRCLLRQQWQITTNNNNRW